MKKLWVILKREYLIRVKKRSFILITLLTPLAIGIFMVVAGLIMNYQGDETRDIIIVDEGGIMENRLKDERNFYFSFSQKSLEDLRKEVEESGQYDGILRIPSLSSLEDVRHTIYYYSNDNLDLDGSMILEDIVQDKLREYKIEQLKIDQKQLDLLRTNVRLDPEPLVAISDDEDQEAGADPSPFTSVIGAILGGFMGFVMYIVIFINGTMVMRSVMEEKINRIVEVMISSVRPFYLMMGKILGVGLVGLTQLLIWAILIPLIFFAAQLFLGFDSEQMMAAQQANADVNPEDMEYMIGQLTNELSAINWWVILPLFFLFFVGGYILYATLFAAVGSAIGDDLGESQALTLPITIPVILALYIMFAAVRVPNSTLAVWSSIFPFFSPVVMPARLAFHPPWWQVALSLVLLLVTAVFFIYLCGRIYRVGILMYGKKGSFKEIWKWMFMKI